MGRTASSAAAGIAAWIALVIAADFAISAFWPAYRAAKPDYAFSLGMMIARLAESTVALAFGTWVVTRIAPASRAAPWAFGIVMLLFFIPIHYWLRDKFPAWYHAYFLASLIVLPVALARAISPRPAPRA
ncbi:MAG TPA: hypothetical protein VG819_07355 [Rhizomicrobium sp.]|jgi:phage FluMu gp28-like protein|nr:hypothetical protein [Rhizomicrobium sp.]